MSDPASQSEIPDSQSEIATLYALAALATSAPDPTAAQSSILAAIMAAFPADSGSLSQIGRAHV